MQRIATMTFVSGWVGFLGVSSLLHMAAILSVAGAADDMFGSFAEDVETLAAAIRLGGNAAVLAAMAEALGALMAAGLLAISGWLFQGTAPGDRAVGERLALVTFGIVGAIYILAQFFATPTIFPNSITPVGFFVVLGASMLAIVLDRLGEITEPDDDEPQFRAAVALIGRRMAQDAHSLPRDPEHPGL